MILHFGVIDLPYANAPKEFRRHPTAPKAGTETTGDVATWLENKYHVMETYYSLQGDFVADQLAESIKGALENLMMGAPPSPDPFLAGASQIEKDFKDKLSQRAFDGLIPGLPTKAAKEGRSLRFKSGINPKGERPSLIDTGLYQASMKVWVD